MSDLGASANNASEPVKKRKRSSSFEAISVGSSGDGGTSVSSSTSSRKSQRVSKLKKLYNPVEHWVLPKRHIKDHNVLCVYDSFESEKYNNTNLYPEYIKYGSQADIFDVSGFRETDSLKLLPLDLNKDQMKMFKCFCDCVEQMFGGLQFEEKDNIWVDKLSNREKRKDGCDAVLKKYGLKNLKLFPKGLVRIYEAFTKGFSSSYSRHAMYQIFECCEMVLDVDNHDCINVGGSCLQNPGVSEFVHLKIDLKGLKKEETIEKVKQECNVTEADTCNFIHHVPDFVLKTEKNSSEPLYYMIGKCKAKTSPLKNMQLEWQTWFQALGGLQGKEKMYGCGVNVSTMIFLKLKHCGADGSPLLTEYRRFSFRNLDNFFTFDSKIFSEAVKTFMTIMNEYS